MLVHCGMHPVAYVALTYPYLGWNWVNAPWLQVKGWACVLLITAVHFIEDEWRVYTIHRYHAPDNTLLFFWDQVIHYLSIFVFIPIGFSDLSRGLFPEKWVVLGCLAVLVTHFSTVLIYFLEKDIFGTAFPAFDEKYVSMTMRLVLALCFLLPGKWWVLPASAWALNLGYIRYRRIVDFSWFSLSLGGALSVAGGLMARWIYYS